ncbi:MAG: mercury methylation corrinoid protein HgcA [Spirochaetota bacterium]
MNTIEKLDTPGGTVNVVSTEWDASDRWGALKVRLGPFRMNYAIKPGLYAVGKPDRSSPVMVTANYKLSFDLLRKNLKGIDAFILVLDTKGINVWCAAGKGTFSTQELIRQVNNTSLDNIVNHRRLIVPQLGAPGVQSFTVWKQTGFRVFFGPVYARDIGAFLEKNYRAAPEMRRVRFNLSDRMVLVPIEIIQTWKKFLVYSLAVMVFSALQPEGILFGKALTEGVPLLIMGVLAVLSGLFLTPLLLPLIPFRAFSIKGFLTGLAVTFIYFTIFGSGQETSIFEAAAVLLMFPAASSYLALGFTGSTPITSRSGVEKELKFALPFYIITAGSCIVLLVLHKLVQWGIV